MDGQIETVEFRVATAADVGSLADTHRDSIRSLGAAYYPEPIVDAWVAGVQPDLYLRAMDRGEVFFVAIGGAARERLVLGFSSDYVIRGTTHGTCAYVRSIAARKRIASRLLAMAESFGISRGATDVQIEASLGAVDFYRVNGFVETGRGDVSLPSGFRMPCVFMRKDIHP